MLVLGLDQLVDPGDRLFELFVLVLDFHLPPFHQLGAEGEPQQPADQVEGPDTHPVGPDFLAGEFPPKCVVVQLLLGDSGQHLPILGRFHCFGQPGVDMVFGDLGTLEGQ